jgi:NAD(P)H-hydrate repair Nnr-like enzyme with NAD(P)H-hydrate dehydratase domain
MGDVLSGVIGGLLAQGLASEIAAKLGVLIHALAGDFAAKEGERGLIATDLMSYLRKLVNPE